MTKLLDGSEYNIIEATLSLGQTRFVNRLLRPLLKFKYFFLVQARHMYRFPAEADVLERQATEVEAHPGYRYAAQHVDVAALEERQLRYI